MVNSGVDNANIDPIRKDSSRNACARIKIRFANMNRAEVDALKIQFRSNTDLVCQEIGYYDNILILEMTAKPNTRFYVQSPEYGQSNEVTLNLEGNIEYEMEARLNQSFSIIVDSNTEGAEVYIDGKFKARTDANYRATISEVTIGAHTLKLTYGSASHEQRIDVNKNSISFRQDVDTAASEPQFVLFNVEPKSAVVTINNNHYPLQDGSMSIVLASGRYDYTVTAVGYHPQSGTFTVAGSTVDKRVTLIEDSAKVTITVADNAEIWINGKMKGTGSWSGTLNSGAYIFEARKAGCKSTKISKQISSSAAAQSITLPAPTPIVGTLIVASTPVGASVSVDNKSLGTTPLKMDNLSVGSFTLKLSKAGYADFTQTITISEGKATTVSATLTKQANPTPTSTPATTSASATYNIGDLVTINGVQGIVFQTSPVVKIVSVKETTAKWSTDNVTTNASDKDNGKANMDKIKAISGWQTKYPAFKWCADLGSGWYLPALNELKAIYAQQDKINRTLSANNMNRLGSKFKWFWPSSELTDYYGFSINFSDGCHDGTQKESSLAVRAVYIVPSSADATSAPKTYSIGDLVTVNGVQGIVFQTSPVVKIVSVKETTTNWSTEYHTTNANDQNDGRANMSKIKSISGWETKYPAFKWCADIGDGWYLPAFDEVKTIFVHKEKINSALPAGKIMISNSLWSSTESSIAQASYTLAKGIYNNQSKKLTCSVRAVYIMDGGATTSNKVYKVGDYYNENGKEGVVFEVSADGHHGKIVNLRLSGAERWACTNTKILIGADSKTDGKYNMAKVTSIANWSDNYHAFEWCKLRGTGWYMPSIEELKALLLNDNVRNAVNATLAAKGGIKIESRHCYWSSTESNQSGLIGAWYVDMTNGKASSSSKDMFYFVRAIATF